MYPIYLIFVYHSLTAPASDKSDKSVSLYFRAIFETTDLTD